MPPLGTVLCLVGYAVVSNMIIDFTSGPSFVAVFAQLVGAAVLGAACAVIDMNEDASRRK